MFYYRRNLSLHHIYIFVKESQIAVEIFLPKSHASDKQNLTKATSNKVVEKRGVRLSTRQRAKRERLTVIRQEEESGKAQAGKKFSNNKTQYKNCILIQVFYIIY